jgi:glycine/D-amino acid oxidase-like deaminating enzyme
MRVPVRPIRGQLLQLRWSGPLLGGVIWGERCYIVPWRDGTVLVGATEEDAGFDERTTVAGVRDLIDAACELVPHAWTASVTMAKVGLRPGTPDHLPIIGRSAVLANVVYATGHYRNGILLAPLTAELVADILLEDRSDPMLELTQPQRFGTL